MLTDQLLARARADEPLFITEVESYFRQLPDVTRLTLRLERIDGAFQTFALDLPEDAGQDPGNLALVTDFVCARIYNILSSLGGRRLFIGFDASLSWLARLTESLDARFGIGQPRQDRAGYGRCINVIDRMLEHLDPSQAAAGFRFVYLPNGDASDEFSQPDSILSLRNNISDGNQAVDTFRAAGSGLDGRVLCGIDVGGTDIKVAAAVDGEIRCFKEYDWFPADFTVAAQMIDPILLLVRLVRAWLSGGPAAGQLAEALDRTCPLERMASLVEAAEAALGDALVGFDAIGLCFPDVVVRNKIVGGEVYKTRGMRNNPDIDYEAEFAKLTDLDQALAAFCRPGGQVRLTNDGPMAAFTAAVELAFSDRPERVADGVFAHTLGTELGTGWIDETGAIPDIPLEVYNFIIDLGSYGARQHGCDDLRSVNNFNTGLPGTLQKYASQSGAFRLALKLFEKDRPDLYQDLVDRGFVVAIERDGRQALIVPTEPVDLRKPFLQHLMDLASQDADPACARIFTEIGRYLAVTWAETERILAPKARPRVLFGRLVKNARCFELLQQGARDVHPELSLEVADASIANTRLMKQLEADPEYTVAQFAQAIGAIYFGNVRDA